MTVTLSAARLTGTVTAPPSKSMAHRALIAAALSDGVSRLSGIATSEDVSATVDCLRAMG
ncbi:MAG: 3-phosphoshikimate 1-carboxyvinyltransferase, partial [Clostridia bacterium]|nr:3-phosphoshikimate 1-carboxyvinyltransferase [Clostridia bacterium]